MLPSAPMLFASPTTPTMTSPAPYSPPQPLPSSLADDDDEALQAVLLASLIASQENASQETSASQETIAAQEAALPTSAPALVGPPTTLADFAADSAFCKDVRSALEALGQHNLRLSKIRGDGHCLFRALGAALILGAAWAGRDAVRALDAHLRPLLAHGDAAREAATAILAILAAPDDVMSSLNDEGETPSSPAHALVSALRSCSVAHMRGASDRFRSAAAAYASCGAGLDSCSTVDESEWASYCEGMASMVQPVKYGGHPELVALSECLRVRIEIFDTATLQSGATPCYRLGEELPPSCPTVRALRRGLHYHLLLEASAEGEALPDALGID